MNQGEDSVREASGLSHAPTPDQVGGEHGNRKLALSKSSFEAKLWNFRLIRPKMAFSKWRHAETACISHVLRVDLMN